MEDSFKTFSFVTSTDMILSIIAMSLILWLMTRKPKKYPPGPPKWPIVGNLFQMRLKGKIHLAMNKMSEKYGEVVGMFVGNSPVILISGLDAIYEASMRDDLNGRPQNEFQKILNKGHTYGFISISGETWKIQRRFTLQHLRDFGFGKRTLEVIIHEEIEILFRSIDHTSGGPEEDFGKPVSFHDFLGVPLINILWYIMSGQRYEHDNPKFNRMLTAVKNYLLNASPEGGIIHAYPTIAKLLPGITKLNKQKESRDALYKFIQEEIDEHRKAIDFEHPRDFLDVYLREIEKQEADPDTTFSETQLKQICMDLFLGGTDTTYNAILSVLMNLVLHPDVQSKVHEELDRFVGRDRLPVLEDRSKLLYLEATIKEAQRHVSVTPVGLVHAPVTEEKEISFRGYNIPKESRVLFNLHDLAHNPKYWDGSHKFKPERFLNENGELVQHKAFMPFSSGKRSCLGESLARNNLFLFVTAIMQRYTLSVPYGYPKPSTDLGGSFILFPKRYEVKVQLRK